MVFSSLLLFGNSALGGERLTIAAAADLKFALEEIVIRFNRIHPAANIATIYGSSGKFSTQIRQGAPFDLYFSADIAYPQALYEDGFAASKVQPYGTGRIVLWSSNLNASKMSLADLTDPAVFRIAIANPQHAPYGKRAEEALRMTGMWTKVESKLVYGENVAQAAQFIQSGNAQIGIIALSLALSPELVKQGSYALIPENQHQPLHQGFIIIKRAANNPLALAFAQFMLSEDTLSIMSRYGFELPGKVK